MSNKHDSIKDDFVLYGKDQVPCTFLVANIKIIVFVFFLVLNFNMNLRSEQENNFCSLPSSC